MMKFLFDLFPVILFFAAYELARLSPDAAHSLAQHLMGGFVSGGVVTADQAPILLATAAAIIATVLQILYLLVRGRKIDGMLWLSLAVIVVMGGLTIYFHDEAFIKWKPTILYWAFGLAICISQFGFHTNLMRKAMEEQVKLPDVVWSWVGIAWMLFFVAQGLLNLLMAFVVFKGNTDAWVKFKMFGAPALMFAFVVAQTLMLSKHIQEEDA